MISKPGQYLRRLASADPVFAQGPNLADDVFVVNIDFIQANDQAGTMVYDLSDGTSIRLDFERYTR